MATLTIFRRNIESVLGLDTTASGSDETLIDYYVNEGIREILLLTRCYVTSTTITTLTSADYTIVTPLLDIVKMYWSSGGSDYTLDRISVNELIDMRRNASTTGPTRKYALAGANLLMWFPTPGTADTLTMYYVPYPTALSAGGDDPSGASLGGIPVEQHRLIESYGLWKMADQSDDATSQMGVTYQTQFLAGIAQFRKDLSKRGGSRLGGFPLPSRRRGLSVQLRPDQIGV